MKKILALFVLIYSFSVVCLAQENVGIGTEPPDSSANLDIVSTDKGLLILQIPIAPTVPVKELVCDTLITDPYRNLETLNKKTNVWLKESAVKTRTILDDLPLRQKIYDQVKDLDLRKKSEAKDIQVLRDEKHFYLKRNEDEQAFRLFKRDQFLGEEKVIYDPTSYKNGKWIIQNFLVNDRGTQIAVALTNKGTEVSHILCINENGMPLEEDVLKDVAWAALSWMPDDSSFVYIGLHDADVHNEKRYLNTQVYRHFLNQSQDEDHVFFSAAKYPELDIQPNEIPITVYIPDLELMLVTGYSVERYFNLYYASKDELENEHIKWTKFCDKEDEIFMVDSNREFYYATSSKNASNYKIVRTNLQEPNFGNAETIIPNDPEASITSLSIADGGLYFSKNYKGIEARLFFLDFETQTTKEIDLPYKAGTIVMYPAPFLDSDQWLEISGWTQPTRRFRYDHAQDRFYSEDIATVGKFPEYADLVVKHVEVPSHDGVAVPMSIIHHRDLTIDGTAPLLMWGYGAYGTSMSPKFWPGYLTWTLHGGIIAVAHVRGGGELGSDWHLAGMKLNKPNTWRDFIACTEWMHHNDYSAPNHTAMLGASAGGILVGRSMTERPDLYAAALIKVGALNRLRSEFTPNGPANIPEFGTQKEPEECRGLIEMDAYHHIKEGIKYPATLCTSGYNDPRVIVWQPAKFAARLRAASSNSVLLRVDYDGGHFTSDTRKQMYNDRADLLAFALHYSLKK